MKATVPKEIETITLSKPKGTVSHTGDAAFARRERIAKRAAKEIKDGFYVNLGVGMPTLVTEFLEPGVRVWLQSENGILGMGPYPTEDKLDAYVSFSSYNICADKCFICAAISLMPVKRRSLYFLVQ